MKKVLTDCLVVFLLFQTVPALYAKISLTAGVLRLLKPLIEKGVTEVSGVEEPGPFVMAVIYFLEEQEGRAAASFIEGLAHNSITDEETVEKIMNGITGVSTVAAVGFAALGQRDIATKLGEFAVFMFASNQLKTWKSAVAKGETVVIEGGEVKEPSDTGTTDVAVKVASKELSYVQRREDEVLPLLNLVHNRPGAKIFLDEEFVEDSKYGEYMFEDLRAGLHQITIRDAFHEGRVQVFVNPARKIESGFDQIDVEMGRGGFELAVDAGVANQRVYLDGSFVGTTPLKQTVYAGEYELSIRGEWLNGYRQELVGEVGEEVVLKPELSLRGALVVEGAVPATVDLFIDEKRIDWEMRRIYLQPGSYTIRLEDPSIQSYRGTVNISAAQVTYYKPELRFFTGSLSCDLVPLGVKVHIDGQQVAIGRGEPLILEGIVIGEHVVSLENPYWQEPVVYGVQIKRNRTIRADLSSGTLLLKGIPAGTQVYLGDQEVTGQLESAGEPGVFRSVELLAGSYEVSVRGQMVAHDPVRVEVKAGEETGVELAVQRLGVLDLHVDTDALATKGYRIDVRQGKSRVFTHVYRSEATESLRLPEGLYQVEGYIADDVESTFSQKVLLEYGENEKVEIKNLNYSKRFQVQDLSARITELETKYERERSKRRRLNTMGWVSLAGGVGLGGLTVWLWWKSEEAYYHYQSTSSSSEAQKYREQAQLFDILKLSSGIGAGVFVSLPVVLFSVGPRPKKTFRVVEEYRQKLESLPAEGTK